MVLRLKALFVVGVAVAAFAATAGALADPPVLEPNPGSPQAIRSENCVGFFSSQVIHNGVAVREQAQADPPGTRADLVHVCVPKH